MLSCTTAHSNRARACTPAYSHLRAAPYAAAEKMPEDLRFSNICKSLSTTQRGDDTDFESNEDACVFSCNSSASCSSAPTHSLTSESLQ